MGQEEREHAVLGHSVEADGGCGADPDPGSLSENIWHVVSKGLATMGIESTPLCLLSVEEAVPNVMISG